MNKTSVFRAGRKLTIDSPVVRNAVSLFGSSIVTSGFGFIYWIVAAKIFTPTQVGRASALQSATQFVAYVCIFGLGTLAIAELSEDRSRGRAVVGTMATATALTGLVGGLFVAFLLRAVAPTLRPGLSGVLAPVVFVVLCALTTTTLLLDEACVGLLRGDIQLQRNLIFSVAKLLFLPVIVTLFARHNSLQILLAWVLGSLLSIIVVRWRLQGATYSGSWRPQIKDLITKRSLIYKHHWLNVSILAPRQLMPVIVATVVGPAANASFYTATLIVSIANVIPYQLSTALFALKPGDEIELRNEVRRTAGLCLITSVLSALFFLFASRHILELFRHSYTSATDAMIILGFCTLPSAVKAHYVAIARVRKKMGEAATRSTLAAVVELTGCLVGAVTFGVTGVAAGLLVGYLLESFLLGPTVWRVLRG